MTSSRRNSDPVRSLIQNVATDADREAQRIPEPDTNAIIEAANAPRTLPTAWVPRIAAAAAVLAAVIGILTLVQLSSPSYDSLPDGPVPEHLTALVDSLYSNDDYVVDELAPMLRPAALESDSDYMDDIWQTVITEIEDL